MAIFLKYLSSRTPHWNSSASSRLYKRQFENTSSISAITSCKTEKDVTETMVIRSAASDYYLIARVLHPIEAAPDSAQIHRLLDDAVIIWGIRLCDGPVERPPVPMLHHVVQKILEHCGFEHGIDLVIHGSTAFGASGRLHAGQGGRGRGGG